MTQLRMALLRVGAEQETVSGKARKHNDVKSDAKPKSPRRKRTSGMYMPAHITVESVPKAMKTNASGDVHPENSVQVTVACRSLERLVARARHRHNPPVLSWSEFVSDVGAADFDVGTAAGMQQLIEATQELSAQGSLHFDCGLGAQPDASIGTNYHDLRTRLAMEGHGAKRNANDLLSPLSPTPRTPRSATGALPRYGSAYARSKNQNDLANALSVSGSIVVMDPQWLADTLSCIIT